MALFDPPPEPSTVALKDGFGRSFSYLRLSLTERCNFRCTYCLPHGFANQKHLPVELSRDELRRAVQAFADLGLWKLRLTGGEPTVRTDFIDIVRELSRIDGVRRLAMTTNGYRLKRSAEAWREAGMDAVNVSIDTLDREGFAKITGRDLLDDVVGGVDEALATGFDAVKVNSVLLRDLGMSQLHEVLAFVSDRDVSWRFIELMRTNDNRELHAHQATPGETVRERLFASGWTQVPHLDNRGLGSDGPAVEYSHPEFRGRIGLIAPYSPGFCSSCNRLRLSSRGKLHLCLFGAEGLDLRDLLQDDNQRQELSHRIRSAMPSKAVSHRLDSGDSGGTPHLASIGG